MKLAKMIGVFVLLGVLLVSHNAHGWGEIAHIAIVQKANDDPNINIEYLGELADAWGSYEREWFLGIRGVIIPHWCWNHNTLRSGLYLLIPPEPTYADWDEPGKVMFLIWQNNKIETPNANALQTAMSFSIHNAMDNPEHFEYFLGGTLCDWYLHHYHKERWADYVVGSKGWGGQFKDIQAGPYTTADIELIHLAQRVFVKNRRYVDSDNPNGIKSTIQIQDSLTIANILADYQDDANEYINEIRAWNWITVGRYKAKAAALRRLGYSWSEAELELRFNNAAERAKNVYRAYAPQQP